MYVEVDEVFLEYMKKIHSNKFKKNDTKIQEWTRIDKIFIKRNTVDLKIIKRILSSF